MLKKIKIHFQEENINELNKFFPNTNISHLMDYLLNNFIKENKNKSWEDRNELQKNIQEFIQQSKEKRCKKI